MYDWMTTHKNELLYSHLPPTRVDDSNIVTSTLAFLNSLAAAKPDNPAPITTTDVDDDCILDALLLIDDVNFGKLLLCCIFGYSENLLVHSSLSYMHV